MKLETTRTLTMKCVDDSSVFEYVPGAVPEPAPVLLSVHILRPGVPLE